MQITSCLRPAIASLCGILWLSACGSGEPEPPQVNQAAKAEPSPLPEPLVDGPRDAEIPLETIGLVDQSLHREPSKAAWQGEEFNDLASTQLKELGKLLEHPANLGPDSFEQLFAPGAPGHLLAPSTPETRFKDEAFEVVAHTGTATTIPLAEFIAPLASATGLRTKFKIFTVELDAAGEPGSVADFQISGTVASQSVAIRARWHCTWSWPDPGAPPLLKSISASEVELTRSPAELFTDCTRDALSDAGSALDQFSHGIDHWASRLERRYGIGLSGWHGIAVGDANGDGLDDVYVCEPGGLPNRLLIHAPDGRVIDASSLSGTDFRLQTQSAIFADLDNDGDQDLALATTLGVILMANDGRGNFTVKSSRLIPEAAPLSVSAADYDLDGDLDLYFGCYSLRSSNVDGVQILGRPIPYHDANNGGRNVLLRNDRDWRFTEATRELGLDENNRRFTMAASWEDYDDDGDPDLYVANDYGRNNLYRNDRDAEGNSHFTDVAKAAGVEDISAGMSVSWSDADGDGDRDLYVSNMWSSAGNRIAYQRNFLAAADAAQRAEFQRHARGNSLFLNNGDGTFSDASLAAGVTMGRWAWGSRFADLNNDGLQDIVVANGFITQPDDSGDL